MRVASLRDALVRDEGYKLVVYADSLGIPTAGIGHKLLRSDGLKLGDSVTPEWVETTFQRDLATHTAELQRAFPWVEDLDVVRLEALQNLVFNMGVPRLRKFVHFLAYMQDADWKLAAAALKDSLAFKQEPARIERLALQVTSGERQ